MKLPSSCVKTNVPIAEDDIRMKAFAWCPRWVLVLIPLKLLIMLIAFLITKKLACWGMECRRRYAQEFATASG